MRTVCNCTVGPATMTTKKATSLDYRLYAWLCEVDNERFEIAFNAYFSVAFPSIIRHLARITRWDVSQLEELAQDALLRFFDKVGRGRREASEVVRKSATEIRPLHLGALHERQVNVWIDHVESFRAAAMSFRLPTDGSGETTWKASIHRITEQIPPLQRQGCQLLRFASMELRWGFDDKEPHSIAPGGPEAPLDEELLGRVASVVVTEQTHPGATRFVQGTCTIVRTLPRLRVPTNGYLFDMAMTIYLDECKRRGTRKRSGVAFTTKQTEKPDQSDLEPRHPIEELTFDSAVDVDQERFIDVSPMDGAAEPRELSVDPAPQYEYEDLFEKFYAFLKRPVDDAIDAFHAAQKVGRAVAEQRRMQSLADKFARTMSVLSMMGEGHTQEQTAEQLGLSRNQVKYIIELVQEAFERFSGHSERSAVQFASAGGTSHDKN